MTGGVLLFALACTGPNPAFWPLGIDGGPPPGRDAVPGADTPADRASVFDQGTMMPVPDAEPPGLPDSARPDGATPPDGGAPRDVAEAAPSPDLLVDRPADRPADAGPRAVTIAGVNLLDPHGGAGGAAHSELCPGDEVIIGYQVTIGGGTGLVYGLLARCGALSLAPGAGVLNVTARGTLPGRGGAGTNTVAAMCPPNQVVVGVNGRASDRLDAFEVVCGVLTNAGAPSTIAVDVRTALGRIGGTSGDAFFQACPGNQVVRGQQINDGAWIDAYGAICGQPTVAP